MSEGSIRLNNYFFNNVTGYDPNRNEPGGSTRRMPNGKIKTYHSGVVYYTFDITLEQVSPEQLGHFIYLDNLCKPKDGSISQTLDFWDDTNGEALDLTFPISITIPDGGLDFERENGEGETYEVELKLEQVLEG